MFLRCRWTIFSSIGLSSISGAPSYCTVHVSTWEFFTSPEEHGPPLASPRPSQSLRRSERTPPPPPPAALNHAELISSFSTLGDKAGHLEGELKALKKEKAREEGVLKCLLKNLEGEHTTLQEKYVLNVQCIGVVRAELEGMQAGRDSELKEMDTLRVGRDEMLQTHDRLLDQLTESQRQAQIMEATLEGTRTAEGLSELVRSSDAGHDLLFQHFSLAMKRTIRAVQARL
ncbi:hypothetical protein LIER_35404 [Lithospermum erythrorhizon]|uniref:Uncharacterized protein n=1 Tax=Lithospermum erythrorhizon TaxID=34254 RepID=A0AAV3NQ64_LITER